MGGFRLLACLPGDQLTQVEVGLPLDLPKRPLRYFGLNLISYALQGYSRYLSLLRFRVGLVAVFIKCNMSGRERENTYRHLLILLAQFLEFPESYPFGK